MSETRHLYSYEMTEGQLAAVIRSKRFDRSSFAQALLQKLGYPEQFNNRPDPVDCFRVLYGNLTVDQLCDLALREFEKKHGVVDQYTVMLYYRKHHPTAQITMKEDGLSIVDPSGPPTGFAVFVSWHDASEAYRRATDPDYQYYCGQRVKTHYPSWAGEIVGAGLRISGAKTQNLTIKDSRGFTLRGDFQLDQIELIK